MLFKDNPAPPPQHTHTHTSVLWGGLSRASRGPPRRRCSTHGGGPGAGQLHVLQGQQGALVPQGEVHGQRGPLGHALRALEGAARHHQLGDRPVGQENVSGNSAGQCWFVCLESTDLNQLRMSAVHDYNCLLVISNPYIQNGDHDALHRI